MHDSGTTSETAVPAPPDAVAEALARVLRSDGMRRSRRTSDFLRFVVTETLAGRGRQLKESTVAIGALGKEPLFDPRVDPAVRVQARRVRAALERYYAGPGVEDPIRITMPRGGYAAVFETGAAAARSTLPVTAPLIAVASLVDLTPDDHEAHLAPGLSETLVAGLSRLPGCRVVGPVATGATGWDAASVGARHGARFVLGGSARTRGGVLRVSLRLVDTDNGETAWSEIFDRPVDGAVGFEVEDSIAAEVGAALAVRRW